MKTDIIKSIMHPIRIKIIQELNIRKQATTKEILKACGDCSQATLYRHIKTLLKHEIIEIVQENNVHGIIEKVYALNTETNEKILGDPKALSREDYLKLFTHYMLSLLADFSTYMKNDDALNNIENQIGFSSSTLLLTDQEFQEMFKEIGQTIMKYMNNQPKEGRKLRKVSQVVTTTLKKNKGERK
jgi:DNA-binding transcriptional ArsR family regulator